ncbi:MAG: hypothetical protein Q9201_003559 [Fulgogasparrea decipioides]
MADLKSLLSSFGLGQYHEHLVQAGFDTWETILDITEDDLETLNVQRGHRRRLQQEIAYTLKFGDVPGNQRPHALSRSLPAEENTPSNMKRQYNRHPKPDPNAPQRPHSAYVLFSNTMQEELNKPSLSFAEKSRIVGNRWQALPDESKHHWQYLAAGPQEKYKADLGQYQNTKSHREYQAYLADFNASQSEPSRKRKAITYQSPGQLDHASPERKPHITSPSASDQPTAFKRLAPIASLPSSDSATVSPQKSKPNPPKRSLPKPPRSTSTSQLQSTKTSRAFSHACESCKRKKLKCDGATPTCERCSKTNTECCYAGGIRDKEKRLVGDIADKLDAWENTLRRIKPELGSDYQNEIDRLLLMSPQSERARKLSFDQGSRTTQGESSMEPEGDAGGESDVSDVGSMGSTDHFNEELFAEDSAGNGRINAFLGQTATDNWVERLKSNLKISDSGNSGGLDHLPEDDDLRSSKPSDKFLHATRGSEALNERAQQLEPYELPSKASADLFVTAYFGTVHPSFPILSRTRFLMDYEQLYSVDRSRLSDPVMAILHLVLALGAVHTYMTQAPWASEERAYLLRFAMAKATVLDSNIFRVSGLEQVQVCGLGGLYLLVIAWNVAGLGIRAAQALGMHLINITPNFPDRDKNLRLGIWFSVLSLERTMTVITGRPSMVRDLDCSVRLPRDGLIDPDKDQQIPMPFTDSNPWAHSQDTGVSVLSPIWQHLHYSGTADPVFFLHCVELSSLSDEALSMLYSARIRHTKWSEVQTTIRKLDQNLSNWNAALDDPYPVDAGSQKPGYSAVRTAIGMLFHSTRIIINRPCLCRLDRRIMNQSNTSDSINIAAADRCVVSARTVVAFLSENPEPAIIYRGPLWWMAFHHLKRATTILILEMTFQSEHTPATSEDILADAKKAINWLRVMGASSNHAYSSWVTLSQLLRRAAEKFGGDVSDTIIAEEKKKGKNPDPVIQGQVAPVSQGQERPLNLAMEPSDPVLSMAFRTPGGGENMFGGDLAWSEWDQYGSGQGNVFSAVDDIDEMVREPQGGGWFLGGEDGT